MHESDRDRQRKMMSEMKKQNTKVVYVSKHFTLSSVEYIIFISMQLFFFFMIINFIFISLRIIQRQQSVTEKKMC